MHRFLLTITLVTLVGSLAGCGMSMQQYQAHRHDIANHIYENKEWQTMFVAIASTCFALGLYNQNAHLPLVQRVSSCVLGGVSGQPQGIVDIYNQLAPVADTNQLMNMVGTACLGNGTTYRTQSGGAVPSSIEEHSALVNHCIQRGATFWLSSPPIPTIGYR